MTHSVFVLLPLVIAGAFISPFIIAGAAVYLASKKD
jgi:hypothetical protein